MFGEKGLSSSSGHGFEGFKTKHVKQSDLGQGLDNPDEKIGVSGKGLELPAESESSKRGNLTSQELTLSYLCESGKMGFPHEKISASLKGKEVVLESSCDDERWVVRDFLQLSDKNGGSSKREIEDDAERERNSRDNKKAKMETLNLSLALPDVSLTLNTSNSAQNPDPKPQIPLKPSRSVQSLAISNNFTQTTCSDDFTAASLSHSYSHQYSHNPSCSLTRNSTENYEYSVGSHNRRENDKIWHCGEGTNGSVHSRFRPVGDGVELAGHGADLSHSLMNRSRSFNKDMSNSLYKAACSNSNSFFPSELPARSRTEAFSPADHIRIPDALDDRTKLKLSRIVLQCVSESVTVMSQFLQELPVETVESTKDYLRNLIAAPEGKNGLLSLQNQLERRSDLTKENLSKSHRLQLEILVTVKFGLGDFLSQKIHVPSAELVEIFLLLKCRNVSCKSLLPVDDCECKICSTKKGYCSHCMCPVCLKFDSASNTCSWVGCDVCSHWCHASCGIEKNFIRSGSSSKGPLGTSGMHFHCPGCGHASEMLGFVKDVFECCAKNWSVETLMKELDCVRKIFKGSDDVKGKTLYLKAQETIYRLERRVMSSYDACNLILHFFSCGGTSDSQKDITTSQPVPTKEIPFTPTNLLSLSTTSSLLREMLPQSRDFMSAKLSNKNDGFENLESVVRIKEAETRMFQIRADEARKEAEGYQQLARMRAEKLDEEYAEKLAKLCLQETEERRRKKMEELKLLESSHCDYYNMKIRMQADIAGLLQRMESTKQQLV